MYTFNNLWYLPVFDLQNLDRKLVLQPPTKTPRQAPGATLRPSEQILFKERTLNISHIHTMKFELYNLNSSRHSKWFYFKNFLAYQGNRGIRG